MDALKCLAIVYSLIMLAACADPGRGVQVETHRCVEIPNGLVACELLGDEQPS